MVALSCAGVSRTPVHDLMKYCPECGTRLEAHWISTEGRERLVCALCAKIRYENPRILVALMLTCGDRLLLCRRAQQPSLGAWTPPSGFMERGETLERAAAREALEEAGVRIDPERLILYSVSSLPKISEVYVVFRAIAVTIPAGPAANRSMLAFSGSRMPLGTNSHMPRCRIFCASSSASTTSRSLASM
jgi:ADP-ribose pyrophosphatase YjhB (NUDIX family)